MPAKKSLRDRILEHRTIVPVKACGTTVYLRPMNGPETVSLHKWQSETEERTGMDTMAHVLVRCICDEGGQRLFADDEAELLSSTIAAVDLRTLFDEAQTLNGLTEAEVEEAEGN